MPLSGVRADPTLILLACFGGLSITFLRQSAPFNLQFALSFAEALFSIPQTTLFFAGVAPPVAILVAFVPTFSATPIVGLVSAAIIIALITTFEATSVVWPVVALVRAAVVFAVLLRLCPEHLRRDLAQDVVQVLGLGWKGKEADRYW